MATDQSTVDYILEQLASVGSARARKMFGEYALYVNEKVVGLICDNQLFIKFTDGGKKFAEGHYTEGRAYPGAKPSMNVTDEIDNGEFLRELVVVTARGLGAKART